MKIIKIVSTLVLSAGLMIGANSCSIHLFRKGEPGNGKHRGWYKNPNNPHHPNTTNPGHTKSPGKAPKGKTKGPK